MLNFGVVGFGYWGPNVVRNLTTLEGVQLCAISDLNPKILDHAQKLYPHTTVYTDYKSMIQQENLDAVCIITPVSTHFAIAKYALEHGKHIFIEKPFTENLKQADQLISLAQKKKRLIMVDHTFIFTGAVQKIKEMIANGTLGQLYYYDSTRVSLGLFQNDVNVIWDLAPHDFSIIDYVIKNKVKAISAQGTDHFKRGHENIAYITLFFENNMIGHVNVNWLSPVKVRTTLIGGEKKMLLWDDLEADEKIKIYDKGVVTKNKQGIYQLMVDYRAGDIWAPRLDRREALKVELEYFVECIQHNKKPINDGESGQRILKMLIAATQSLKKEGKKVLL